MGRLRALRCRGRGGRALARAVAGVRVGVAAPAGGVRGWDAAGDGAGAAGGWEEEGRFLGRLAVGSAVEGVVVEDFVVGGSYGWAGERGGVGWRAPVWWRVEVVDILEVRRETGIGADGAVVGELVVKLRSAGLGADGGVLVEMWRGEIGERILGAIGE